MATANRSTAVDVLLRNCCIGANIDNIDAIDDALFLKMFDGFRYDPPGDQSLSETDFVRDKKPIRPMFGFVESSKRMRNRSTLKVFQRTEHSIGIESVTAHDVPSLR